MKRRLMLPLTVAALILATAGWAQPPGGGGGAPNFSPAARAKMEKWGKWRESHRNFTQLGGTMRNIVEMDKEAATKLTKDQAKKIWAIISPWTGKPVMTDAQAADVNKRITNVLTVGQVKKMAALQAAARQRFGGGGGGGRPGGGGGGGGFGGGGGGARPGGGGGGGGRMGNFNPETMPDPKEYNPLNVNSYPNSPMTQRGKQSVTQFINLIKSRAV